MRFLTPEGFGLILSLELVLMVTIGGLGSLRGAILGAVLISLRQRLVVTVKDTMIQPEHLPEEIQAAEDMLTAEFLETKPLCVRIAAVSG